MSLLQLQSVLGLAVFTGIAWLLSENRRLFSWRLLAAGIGLQLILALLLLKVPYIRAALFSLNGLVDALMAATGAGTSFVFGYLGGGPAPFDVTRPENGLILAFQALPLVLVMSALSALLWHWRILPLITSGLSYLLQRSLGIGGAVGLSSAANVFVGMIEAPLLIKPFMERLTRGELFMVMSVGLATVSGTVLILYASVVEPVVPGALGHILTASLISLPASILIARIMVPDEVPEKTGDEASLVRSHYASSMDAITKGTADGLTLLLNIIAMLVVILALVALVNILLGLLPDMFGAPLTLQRALGWLFAPLVWCMGISASEAQIAGQLMGTKTILNEFLAYLDLARLPHESLSDRSRLIMVYSLCGFANFGSVGMVIGAFSVMAPGRRNEVVELAIPSLIAGTLATSMTGAVIGIIN